MGEFLVITGLSGAGRSSVGDDLEDLGWFVIDNLPPALIPKVAELAEKPGSGVSRVALAVGGGLDYAELGSVLRQLRSSGATVRTVFLTASTEALVRRYESTRRVHPLDSGGGIAAAIEAERRILQPVKDDADIVIDTTSLNVHDLKRRVGDLFGDEHPESGMRVQVVSFGFKHGTPRDADIVFDCRFLPNPHWVDELRPRTGLEEPVRDYVLGQDLTMPFLRRLEALLAFLLPAYVAEGKAYLTIALGCTGGRHRSVVVAEELARWLRGEGVDPRVTHRDVGR